MQHLFHFPSRLEEISTALDQLERLLRELSVEHTLVSELRLVAEESLVNIADNAYEADEEGTIGIGLTVSAIEVRIVIRDRGRPFNPLDHPAPELDLDAGKRPEGGLGIHLMRSLTDEQIYSREDDENILVLVRRRRVV